MQLQPSELQTCSHADVPTAPIARISHSKLLANDASECASVLEACRTHGFFYLDLTETESGSRLLDESEELLQLSYAAFDHPLETKRK